jgi:PAS domain S-box-containing protein
MGGKTAMSNAEKTWNILSKLRPALGPYLRLFGITIGGIFVAELLSMALIAALNISSYIMATLIDASILSLLVFPLLYFSSLLPLLRQVTERQRVEAAVLQLSSVVEQTADTVVITDREGRIEYANPAFEQLTGYTKEEALGKTPGILKSGLHDGQFYQKLWSTILAGDVFFSEITNRKKNGELYHEVKTISPLRDAQGRITHFVATGKNITEHKQAEQLLERQNRDLRTEITERKKIQGQLQLQTTALQAAANGVIITDIAGSILWANSAFLSMTGYCMEEVINQTPKILYSGKHGHNYYQNLWSTILKGGIWRGETTNRRKDGTLYIEEQTITPVSNASGEIINFIAIKQDVTDRKLMYAQLEQNNRELERLYESEQRDRKIAETLSSASSAFSQTLDVDLVMKTILDCVQSIILCDVAFIVLSDSESHLAVRAIRGSDSFETPTELLNNLVDLVNEPLIKSYFDLHESILIQDSRSVPGWNPPAQLASMHNWFGVPLETMGKVIGMVVVAKFEPEFFRSENLQLVEAVIGQATVALQNAWLFEQVRAGRERMQMLSHRLVEIQESERRYISRELHDETGQTLTSLKLGLHLLEQEIIDNPNALTHVADLKNLADQVLESLHQLSINLRPASLDHLGLIETLKNLVETVGQRSGLNTHFKTLDNIQVRHFREDIETSIYRIVQEALTNVVRHAQASYVDVILENQNEKILLIVEDDGIGFDTSLVRNNGRLGLLGMQERAEMLGGTLLIESTPGSGTTLVAEIPYVDSNPNYR